MGELFSVPGDVWHRNSRESELDLWLSSCPAPDLSQPGIWIAPGELCHGRLLRFCLLQIFPSCSPWHPAWIHTSPKNHICLFPGERYGLFIVQPLICAALQTLRVVLLWAVLCKEDRAPSEGWCTFPVPRVALRIESSLPGPSGKGSGRGLPGVAMECNKEKASSYRQVESLLGCISF